MLTTTRLSELAPELVVYIMNYLPTATAAAAAVTCQRWKDPALDSLWHTIDLYHLLSVLAPVEETDGDLVSEVPFLSSVAWTQSLNIWAFDSHLLNW